MKLKMNNRKMSNMLMNLSISIISLVAAIIVSSIIIASLGANPLDAYGALIKGAFGTRIAFTITLTKSVPLILTGLAVALAFKCSVFNIGVEGQLLLGAMIAAIAGAWIKLPAFLHIPLVLLLSMAGGMLWALGPAILNQKRNVHIVISTIMFNYIGQYLVQYLILGPFKGEGAALATKTIHDTARLPRLLPRPYLLNWGLPIALLAIVAVHILFNRTSVGYEMRAVGLNERAARSNGINVERNMFFALLFSGALAGLAGGIEVTGSLGKIVNGFSPNYGFNGIPVALMARNNPFMIFFSALLIGTMRSASLMMQSTVGVSQDMIDIIQGLIIVFLCSEYVIRYFMTKYLNKGGEQRA